MSGDRFWTRERAETVGACTAILTLLGSIHAFVIVPMILNQAALASQAYTDASMQRHNDWAEATKDKLVTRGEFELMRGELALIHAQLERIENKMGR